MLGHQASAPAEPAIHSAISVPSGPVTLPVPVPGGSRMAHFGDDPADTARFFFQEDL